MRKLSAAAALLGIVTIMILATGVFAATGSPHFIKNATSATLSGSNLVVNFKEAGLPSGAKETVRLSATEQVGYECVNGGGNNPQASNKRFFTTTGSVSGTFTADQNGNIVGSLSLAPPSASSLGFSCPPGQTVTFVGITYSNITVSDLTSGATISLPGTYSYKNPAAP